VGFSLGGAVALEMALQRPESVPSSLSDLID
jgi:pimeloyl-ACP methyl ester carboxylesterase